MRKTKVIALIGLLTIATLAGCGKEQQKPTGGVEKPVIEELEEEQSLSDLDNAEVYQAYADFIDNYTSYEWEKIYDVEDYGWNAFALIEFDGDADPELIATNTDEMGRVDGGMQCYLIVDYTGDGFHIMETSDGVASAGGYRGTKYYVPGAGIVYDLSNDAPLGAPGASIFTYQNGTLEYTNGGYLQADYELEYPECVEKGTWYWDDEEVTEEEYNEKLNAITEDQSGIALAGIHYGTREQFLSGLKAEALLDQAVAGEIPVTVYNESDGSEATYLIPELPQDENDPLDYFEVGPREDLDNDGERELIIYGPYGGKYVDARDGGVYELTCGDGTALHLCYADYNNKTYICHVDNSHGGRETFLMDQYNGDGEIVESTSLRAEFWELGYFDETAECHFGDEAISTDRYLELREMIFGY